MSHWRRSDPSRVDSSLSPPGPLATAGGLPRPRPPGGRAPPTAAVPLQNRAAPRVAAVTDREAAAARSTDQQSLQQRQTFAGRLRQDVFRTLREVAFESVLVGQVLVPTGIAFVVILNRDEPTVAGHL